MCERANRPSVRNCARRNGCTRARVANVISAVIGGIAGWEGWTIGLGISVVATILVVISESGALLLVRTTKISVDDQITLHLHISDDAKRSRIARGRVVRVEEVGPGDAGPWLRRVGVRFDRPLEMHETEIEAFRKRAERLGLS